MNTKLQEIVTSENEFWSQEFQKEITSKNNSLFSHYWWQNYYKSLSKKVSQTCNLNPNSQVLEAGSGLGKASILLGKNISRTLVDISENALRFAKILAKKFKVSNIHFVKGDIFNLKEMTNHFNLVWNIGVIEHYRLEEIEKIFSQMIVATKNNGYVAFGVPNFWTGATLKAYLLSISPFKSLKGYRLNSEKFYSEKIIINTFEMALTKSNFKVSSKNISYHGNPTPIESPIFLQNTIGAILEILIPKSKFLTLYIYKIKKL